MECPICLEPCESDVLVTECCRKQFHTSCHTKCMKVNRACPTCRAVTVQIEQEENLVEVRVMRFFWIIRRMVFVWVGCTILGFFIGFTMYSLITQSRGSNSTNTTTV